MDLLLLDRVSKRFNPADPPAVDGLSLRVAEGEILALLGPSGCGKTTTLRLIAGLESPDAGTITLHGQLVAGPGHAVPPEERGIGIVFQDYALFPHLSVRANLGYGLHRLPASARVARVSELAERFGIVELLGRRTTELSGGQKQRVALARALAPKPRLLLLDEPLSALDAPTREALRGELRRVLEQAGVPAIVVTHDRTEALALGDRLAVLVEGRIRQVGPVHEVFTSPVDVEVARVVGTENVFPARVVRSEAGLVTVKAGGAVLIGIDPGGLQVDAYACIRAEEVVLEPLDGHVSSAQNRLAGEVSSRRDEGPLSRITVECGLTLVALVTRSSAERLLLRPGSRVSVVVKAPSVRVVPRGG